MNSDRWFWALGVGGALLIAAWLLLGYSMRRRTYPFHEVVNNLRVLEGAKDQWALEKKQTNGTRPTWTDLAPYLKGGTIPSVLGESYYLNTIGTPANVRLTVPLGTYRVGSSITVP